LGPAASGTGVSFSLFSAAAQLDHFSLREKVGTRTVLADGPENNEKLKARPMDHWLQAPTG
jgi:hypothetical protein